jgi:hypothetical protein
VPECKAEAWRSSDVRRVLEGEVLDKYIDVLIASIQRVKQSESGRGAGGVGGRPGSNGNNEGALPQRTARLVIEALTLKCPNCQTALDPNPDGCCAMRCAAPGCGVYFCWLCFRY